MSGSLQIDVEMFANDWQLWTVLRHFLPARLQRALACAVVAEVSGRSLSLADLFEEVCADAPIWQEAWWLRRRPAKTARAVVLQRWVQSVAWQTDEDGFGSFQERDEDGEDSVQTGLVEALARLSVVDFDSPELAALIARFDSQFHPSLKHFCSAVLEAKTTWRSTGTEEFWSRLEIHITTLVMPLRGLVRKHVADLCADADAWRLAGDGYSRVRDEFAAWEPPAELSDAASAWTTLAAQSEASARRMVDPPPSGRRAILGVCEGVTLESDPLLAANTGRDVLDAYRLDKLAAFEDPRVTRMAAPLLHEVHDPSDALTYWARGDYQSAHRRLWALLRRQIALGSSTEARMTKGWYARALLDDIADRIDREDDGVTFRLAVHLLLEAEDADAVKRVRWTSAIVDAYVTNGELIDGIIARAEAHEGAKTPRTRVLIELLKAWATLLTPSRGDLVLAMWRCLARIASDFDATFYAETDVGRPALKALHELGRKRPELRHDVGADVAAAICRKLAASARWGRAEAAETALSYADAFDSESLRGVASAVLDALESEDPARDFFPLSGPAFRFLVSSPVRHGLGDKGEFDRRCLREILRYGLAAESGQLLLFFLLADFDESLLTDEKIRDEVRGPRDRVMRGALAFNASNVTDHIRALLLAPHVAGREGIESAFDGLERVLDARADQVSIGLPYADGPLMILEERLESIRAALPGQESWLESRLLRVVECVICLWNSAATNPLLFAPFALPPRSKPSHALVHNCAFASVRFATVVQQRTQMVEALKTASANPMLRGPIVLALAGTHGDLSGLDISTGEDRDSFYDALGRRIALLQAMPREEARSLGRVLLERCMRFGPRAEDAAVFLSCLSLGLEDDARICGLEPYAKRLDEDQRTRLLLRPIIDSFMRGDETRGSDEGRGP